MESEQGGLTPFLARRLLQEDTFVLFHVDGDRTWKESRTSENVTKFDQLVRVALPQVVDRGRANAPRGRAQALEPAAARGSPAPPRRVRPRDPPLIRRRRARHSAAMAES
jgi:hypothetical protein